MKKFFRVQPFVLLLIIMLAGLACITETAADPMEINTSVQSGVYYMTDGEYKITNLIGTGRIEVQENAEATIYLDGVELENAISPLRLLNGANVTLILMDGTTNTFACNGIDTAGNAPQAGIHVPSSNSGTTSLTIEGENDDTGILIAKGGAYSAGIGGGPNQAFGNITIKGGNVTAETRLFSSAPTGNGAGIGGGGGNTGGANNSSHDSKITISGNSIVNATSAGNGAGIGGGSSTNGNGGKGETIEIYGNAIVTATSNGNGAGIGGGFSNNSVAGAGGNISIHGNATVTATSEKNGTGIGGGSSQNTGTGGAGGDISIYENAIVTATGKGFGAAIGGGGSNTGTPGASGNINIHGNPIIVAKSTGSNSRDIGPGVRNDATLGAAGNIKITGGNVHADNTSAVTVRNDDSHGNDTLVMVTVTTAKSPGLSPNEKRTYDVNGSISNYEYNATTNENSIAYLWLPSGNYFVSFDTDGGTPIPNSQSVDNTATLPSTIPTKIGYIFANWIVGGLTYAFTDPVSTDLIIAADYITDSGVTFPVTYHDNGKDTGTAPVDLLSPYHVGTNVFASGNTDFLVKNGYTLLGWNKTGAGNTDVDYNFGDSFTMPAANVDLYPVWKENGNSSMNYTADLGTQDIHPDPKTIHLSNNTNVTISAGGSYILSKGNFTNITIQITATSDVVLFLDGTNITTNSASKDTSPLQLASGSNVTLVLMDGSENSFICNGTHAADSNMQSGIYVNPNAKLTIRGQIGNSGKLKAIGGHYSAGIGGGPNGHPGNITIEGGNITAESFTGTGIGLGNGAGIGSGGGNTNPANASDKEIIIRGKANVTASSKENGAGIGGGGHRNNTAGTGGTIKIYGDATVTATSANLGAGIGGGGSINNTAGTGGIIEISGNAKVNATTSQFGAAIGGGGSNIGTPGASGTITIDGNPIIVAKATGSNSKDIGPGVRNDAALGAAGNIKITGGNVHADNTSAVTVKNNDTHGNDTLVMVKVTGTRISGLLPNETRTYDVNGSINNYEYTATTDENGEAYLWLPGSYFVFFDTDGGIPVPNIQNVRNIATQPTVNPTKTGLVFKEWQLSGTKYEFTETVTSDLTLIANYIETFTVTFDSDGGTSVSDQTVNYGDSAVEPTKPTKADHAFVEWQLNGATYDFADPVTSNLTLIAVYVETFTVTFNSDGGTSVPTQTINHSDLVAEPPKPTKADHAFIEWQSGGITYDFADPVTSNLTLIAVYVETFTVTFDSDGGTSVPDQTVNHSDSVTKPADPTKADHAFKEWQLNGATYNFADPVTSNLTLVAVYTINSSNGGGSGYGSATITDNTGNNTGNDGGSNNTASVRIEVVCVDENGNELYVRSLTSIVGNREIINAPSIEGYMLVMNEKSSQTITTESGDNIVTFKYVKMSADNENVNDKHNNRNVLIPTLFIFLILIAGIIVIFLVRRRNK